MWLCTQIGFFSVVQKGGHHHIRARVRDDLVRLVDAAGFREPVPIHESVQADYRWRILVGPEQLGLVFTALARTIDYPNFKSRIHARPDQVEKASAYGRLWSNLYSIQERS